MPKIGFEWQFHRSNVRFLAEAGNTWQIQEYVPSKGRLCYWPDPGVAIESDTSEVEIITDAVTTWAALHRQLVFIGDLLTLLTTRSAEDAKLPKVFLQAAGEQQEATGPRRSSRVKPAGTPQALRVAEGRLVANDDIQATDDVVLVPDTNVGRIIAFRLAADIKVCTFEGDRPVMVVAYPARKSTLALGASGDTVHGTIQATMDVPLDEIPARLRRFGFDSSARVQTWLTGRHQSPKLIGFITLIHYILWVFENQPLKADDGPKAAFAMLPRTNLRSVYMNALSELERTAFDAMVNALPQAEQDGLVCPYPYSVGGHDTCTNKLTLFWWLRSIQAGDPGDGKDESLAEHMSGQGPRGIGHDAMSPPLGYPAHEAHPARPAEWFTYSMGQKSTPNGASHVVVEYRQTDLFGLRGGLGTYEQFVTAAVAAARDAGLTLPS
ncbi:hypothetical protein [Nonomuraea sp. NPDC002799]